MWFIKIVLCCCYVFIGHFSSGSSIHNSEIKTRLIKHTLELINNGFPNNSNPVIITSDLVDDQVLGRHVDNRNPLIVVNGDLNHHQIKGYHPSYPKYVISFESIEKLTSLIFRFMHSTIWSIKSPIFILDISKEFNVNNLYSALHFLIHFDMLVSYYMCYDSNKNSTIVYTVNPYTQYAPLPWNQVGSANNNMRINPSLYSLQYPKDLKENYQNFYFDKTQFLGGHNIKLIYAINFIPNSTQQFKQEMINMHVKYIKNFNDISLYSLPDYMEVTTSMYFYENYFDIEMMESGYDNLLHSRSYDASNQMYQLADTNITLINFVTEYREVHFSILTKKTDFLTVSKEININLNFICITILVLLLILLIIIVNNKFHVSQGIMDIVSMSLGMGIISPIGRLSMKITYFFGFLFIFVVMPEFQGQIAAVLSQPARCNVETLKDLYDNKYHVFFDSLLINDMLNEKLWVTEEDQKYLHPSDDNDLTKCIIEAQQNSTIACIDSSPVQFKFALTSENLYVSKESIFKKYYVFWTKKHWALKDKIDKARSIPIEIGIINHYNEEIILRKKIKKMEKIQEAENYERTDFENLVFYFIMFAAIMLWSLVIFGIELIVDHYYSKYKKQEEEKRQFIEKLRARSRIIFSRE